MNDTVEGGPTHEIIKINILNKLFEDMVEARPEAQTDEYYDEEEEKKESKVSKPKKAKAISTKRFKINTLDSNHVQPLLQKLIAADPNW